MLFYLTGSKTFNHDGLNTWLNKPENSKYVNKIESVIYLDSLGSEKLNINLFNTEENFNTSEVFQVNYSIHK